MHASSHQLEMNSITDDLHSSKSLFVHAQQLSKRDCDSGCNGFLIVAAFKQSARPLQVNCLPSCVADDKPLEKLLSASMKSMKSSALRASTRSACSRQRGTFSKYVPLRV